MRIAFLFHLLIKIIPKSVKGNKGKKKIRKPLKNNLGTRQF